MPAKSPLIKLITVLLALSYPLTSHLAVARQSDGLALVSIALLLALLLWPGLSAGRPLAWLAALLVAGGLFLVARLHLSWLPLYLPPVLINAALAWVFGRTLRPRQIPLIERLVRLLHEPDEQIDASILRYARRLTLAWTVLFALMALVNLGLALCVMPSGILAMVGIDPPWPVSRNVWSLFTNLLNYLIAGGFFLAEYAYRRYRFPHQPYRNLLDFVRRSAAVGHLVVRPRRP